MAMDMSVQIHLQMVLLPCGSHGFMKLVFSLLLAPLIEETISILEWPRLKYNHIVIVGWILDALACPNLRVTLCSWHLECNSTRTLWILHCLLESWMQFLRSSAEKQNRSWCNDCWPWLIYFCVCVGWLLQVLDLYSPNTTTVQTRSMEDWLWSYGHVNSIFRTLFQLQFCLEF